MAIEYIPVLDEDGNDVGGYTESVPDTYAKEEPDCFSCNDTGCSACDGSRIDSSRVLSFDVDRRDSASGWSSEPPF